MAEWSILISIDDGINSANAIAAYIEIDKASVSRVTERLVMKDLVSCTPGDDRRSKILALTQKGQTLIRKLFKEAEENDQSFFGCLSPLEQEQLRSIMNKVLQQVPTIHLTGWINNKNREIIMNCIKNILKEATINQWPYPKTFALLKDNGLQRYQVSFGQGFYNAEFEGTFGRFTEASLNGYSPLKANEHFNSEGIKNAILKHVTKKTHYLDFLQDAAENGVTHYKVDMATRSVTYFNSNESASYTEYVPEPEYEHA